MKWRKMAGGFAAGAMAFLSAPMASGGLETFANYTASGSSYTTNTFAGQDGSTWTAATCRGDITVNGKAPTIRNVVNAYIRSGTIPGGVGSLTFKYRKPFSGTAMSNKVLVVGSAGTYTNYVTTVPSTTNEILVFTAAAVNIEGDFSLVITNTASSARIAIDDIEWTGYSAGGGTVPEFGANPGPLGATSEVAMAFTVTATGSPAPTLALQSQTASSGFSFTAGTGELSYTPPTDDEGAQTFTFTASNSAGVATQTVDVTVSAMLATAPTFGANPGPVSATATVATVFTVAASGVPAPTLALQSQTASSGFSFTAETGELSYTPPTDDVGARTFTFTASNGAGVATQTVSVAVAAAPVTIPTVSVTDIGADSFTVHWTACDGASTYQVQIATDTNFTSGGSGDAVVLATNEAVSTTPPEGWVYDISSLSSVYLILGYATNQVLSPVFSTVGLTDLAIDFQARTYGGVNAITNTVTVSISTDGGTNWTELGTRTPTTTTLTSYGALDASAYVGHAGVRVKWEAQAADANRGAGIRYLGISGTETAGSGSIQVDQTLAALAYEATGLELETTYFARARQANGTWSDIVSATTTEAEPAPPAFTSGTSYGATSEVAMAFAVTATGNPAPVVALQETTASGGYGFTAGQLSYTPPTNDVGAQTFTFTASNSQGVATQVVGVAVSSAPPSAPVFGANPGPLGATTGVAVAFTVAASGIPTPALALESTTASSGYGFAPETGQLSYTPPEADLGARSFVFTASNSAGVATQTVSVSVAAAPTFIPAVSVTNFGTNSFTIHWTEVTDALDYQVQVATDTNFIAGVSGDQATIATTANSGLSSGWSYVNGASNAGTYHRLVATTAPGVVSEAFSTTGYAEVVVGYAVATYGGAGANVLRISYSLDDGTNWVVFATNANATSSTYVTGQQNALPAAALGQPGVRIKWHCDAATATLGLRLQELVVSGTQTGVEGTLVVDAVVAALTYGATELEMATTYHVRVRAVDGEWSEVVSAATAGLEPVAPWFTAGAGPYSTTAGVAVAFTVAALGTPTPVLALQAGSASAGTYSFITNSGYFLYLPPTNDVGAQAFTFTASNSLGVATQIVGVAVATPMAPSFTPMGMQSATTGVAMAFTVVANGAPEPVLELRSTTASSGYSFMPEIGWLGYTPPLADAGKTNTFTFTASNLVGVATLTVSVAVRSAPPTIDPIPVQYMLVDDTLDYAITATDPDSSTWTFFCTSAVDSATWSFNTFNGAFSFDPTTNQIGTNVFVFTATDDTYLESAPSNMVVIVNSTTDQVAVAFGQTRVVGEEGGADVVIPVNLAYSGSAWVQIRFSGPTNGTARLGPDFTCSSTNMLVSGLTSNLVIRIVDDNLAEGPESIKVQLVPLSPATAGATTQAIFHLRDNDAFSIMAANICDGDSTPTPGRYSDIGERTFQALCPDVVLVQEFLMTNGVTYRAWVDEHFGADFQYYVGPGGSKPNGIISRFDIIETGEWNDPYVSDREFEYATIDLPFTTQDLHVVSVHLLTSDATTRNNEAKSLTNYIGVAGWRTNGYVVIGGDFNTVDRSESALSTFSSVVTDARKPADPAGDQDTNEPRNKDYDYVLPSPNLNALHQTFELWGNTFSNGLVFDTRIWTTGLPPPALLNDSDNFQHMAVVKVFEIDKDSTALEPPQAFAASAVSQSQIDLSFTVNETGNDVLVVWNDDDEFTAPSGAVPGIGLEFAGGTVLYQGVVSPRSHTGLTSCATYFYRCWSVSGTNYSASALSDVAATLGPDTPNSVWASATNDVEFTAEWNAVGGASAYRLDVSTGPSFSGAGGAWSTLFRETMGTAAGTTALEVHEAADGFDNDAFTMTDGGAEDPAEIRTTSPSGGYVDPAGHAASSNANVYFTTTGATNLGFAIEGIDVRGYDDLQLSFGYRKEAAGSNMAFAVQWSTNGGGEWNAVALSSLPAANAAIGWYMVSNLSLSAGAVGSDNLSLRWEKTGGAAGRVDDILLQGYSGGAAAFVFGYSNRTVAGTSQSVTGLTAAATYYFRVAAISSCTGAFSSVASATTLETLVAPAFGANPGPISTTVGVAVAFAVGASGSPVLVLALADTTATSGYGFEPSTGQLSYTPLEADVGGQTFTFTASNGMGVATQIVSVSVSDLPAEGPVFTSGAAYGATTSVARVFTVTATGYPAPALALADATASGGYGFTPGTGQLSYTPPEADVGGQTFTFTASNSSGVATQTVAVSVAEGLPAPPAALWASVTNIVGFTAAWAAAPLATEYRLDVSTSATFQVSGGASLQSVLASNAATSPALITGEWSGWGLSGSTFVILTQSTSVVTSPVFSTVGFTNLTVDFRARTYGGSASGTTNITISISTNDGLAWTVMGMVAPSTNSMAAMPTLTHTANLGHAQTRVRWQTLGAGGSQGVGISNLVVKGWQPDVSPAYVQGYSSLAVAGTSQGVTGLTASATYYFRVRAVNANGSGADSGVANVTTRSKGSQTIDFPAIGDQLATNEVVLSATASSGLPVAFSVLSGPATVAGGAATFTNAGTVRIVASQAGDGEWNPAPNVTNAFAVDKAVAQVFLSNLSQTYDGSTESVTATTDPAGLTVEFTYNGYPSVPTNAGAYVVTGIVNDARYQGSAVDMLTVSKALATVTLEDLSQTYDGTARIASASTLPAGLFVALTYDGNPGPPTNAGSYAMTGTVSDANYAGSATGTLTVSKADQAINFPAIGDQLATNAVNLSASAGSGLAVAFAVSSGPAEIAGAALTFTGAGTVRIVADQAGDANWNPAPGATNAFTVSKATAGVTLNGLSQPYDGTARTVTATTEPAGLAVDITYNGSGSAPTAAGSYAVTGTVSDARYQGVASGVLTVTELSESVAVGSNDVQMTIGPLAVGEPYELLRRASLTSGDWEVVDSMTGAGETSATLTHEDGGTNRMGYYRIEGAAGPSGPVWGYVKMDKPGNSRLNVVGIPFQTEAQTLGSLMDPLQFSGHHNNSGLADQVMIWDAGAQSYVNLALYDLRAFGAQYASQTGWKLADGFGPLAGYVNPVLPAGSAVWIRGSTTNDRTVTLVGEVVMDGAATNEVVAGLQLVSNPFSETVGLSNLAIHVHATGHHNNSGLADQVMVWDAGTQSYLNLALYDLRAFGAQYASQTGWKLADGFGPLAAYVNPQFASGQGFWIRAVNGAFEWAETNKYKLNLE